MNVTPFKLSNFFTCLFLCLFLSVFLYVYSPLTQIPFYLDDFSSVVNNPRVQPPIAFEALWQFHKARLIPYTGFTYQNQFFGGNPGYFHIIGASIHLLVVLIFFVFCRALCLRQPNESSLKSRHIAGWGAAITAGIFLIHPQNSQAVIYIAQQSVLWMSLFYVLALFAYLQLRTQNSNYIKTAGLLLFLCSAFVCAIFSKQSAATLPLAILLLEWIFFGQWTKRLILLGASCLLGLSFVALALNEFDFNRSLALIDDVSRETKEISRSEYLASQLFIVWHYINQFFGLSGFRLEYDFALTKEWKANEVGLALAHIAAIVGAVYAKRRLPLVAFGILFYYLAHTIESSVFPIRDIVFEHRTYLPNLGLTLAFVSLLFYLGEYLQARFKFKWGRAVPWVALFVFSVLALMSTNNRVEQWTNYKAFYASEIKLSPKSARATAELGTALAVEGKCPEAIGYISHAIALYKTKHDASLGLQPETALNYISCLRKLGIHSKAERWELSLLEQVKEPVRRAQILTIRGTYYLQRKDFEIANQALTESVKLNSRDYASIMNLAIVRVNIGDLSSGQKLLQHALALKPNDEVATRLLGQLNKVVVERK